MLHQTLYLFFNFDTFGIKCWWSRAPRLQHASAYRNRGDVVVLFCPKAQRHPWPKAPTAQGTNDRLPRVVRKMKFSTEDETPTGVSEGDQQFYVVRKYVREYRDLRLEESPSCSSQQFCGLVPALAPVLALGWCGESGLSLEYRPCLHWVSRWKDYSG